MRLYVCQTLNGINLFTRERNFDKFEEFNVVAYIKLCCFSSEGVREITWNFPQSSKPLFGLELGIGIIFYN